MGMFRILRLKSCAIYAHFLPKGTSLVADHKKAFRLRLYQGMIREAMGGIACPKMEPYNAARRPGHRRGIPVRIEVITRCWEGGRGTSGRWTFASRGSRFIPGVDRARRPIVSRAILAGMVLLAGCAAPRTPYPESFNSFRPEERILAARHAAEIGDHEAVPLLVDRLEDDDSAVRMFAILALEKLTGTRLGYDYAADGFERARAVERWRRHVRDPAGTRPAPATRPAGAMAGGLGP
jgi:hypothetical protein